MFIRQTTTRNKKDSSAYQTYRLVDNTRIGGKVKQRTLLNLGANYNFPREKWKAVTQRIDAILHHETPLFSIESDIEQEAQRLAAKIIEKNKEYAPPEAVGSTPKTDFQEVNVDSVESSKLRSIGVESIAWDAFQSLGGCPRIEEPTAETLNWAYFPMIFIKYGGVFASNHRKICLNPASPRYDSYSRTAS